MKPTTEAEALLGQPIQPREMECLRLYAQGLTMGEVAKAMGLSIQTVKNKLRFVYAKLGVNGHVQAFRAVGWLI